MPKSALTGSQKKTHRAGNKVGRKSLKEIERSIRPGENLKQYGKSYELANKMLQPQAQEMRREFQQETAPELISQLGVGAGAKSSSALNQALAASLTNLNHKLTGQTQQLAAQLAESDLNRRQQNAQFGAQIGQQNMSVSPYLPTSGNPSWWKTIGGGALKGLANGNVASGVLEASGNRLSGQGGNTNIGGQQQQQQQAPQTYGNILPSPTEQNPYAANIALAAMG
jgi:hypothetical protein